jgi:hypothetical protein
MHQQPRTVSSGSRPIPDGVLGDRGHRPVAVLEPRRQVGDCGGPGPAGHGLPVEGRAGSPTSTLQVVDPPTEIAWTGTTLAAARPCMYSGSRPATVARSPARRSPGRACWPVCSRATAVRPWTRDPQCPGASQDGGRAPVREGRERAARCHLGGPVSGRAADAGRVGLLGLHRRSRRRRLVLGRSAPLAERGRRFTQPWMSCSNRRRAAPAVDLVRRRRTAKARIMATAPGQPGRLGSIPVAGP